MNVKERHDHMTQRLKELYVKALRLEIEPSQVPSTGIVDSIGVDSIGAMEILIWVEDDFQITIEDEDLSPALVDSLPDLARYIRARQSLARAG